MNDQDLDDFDAALEAIEREHGPHKVVSAQVRYVIPGPYPFEEIAVTDGPEPGDMIVSMPDPQAFQPHYVLSLKLKPASS